MKFSRKRPLTNKVSGVHVESIKVGAVSDKLFLRVCEYGQAVPNHALQKLGVVALINGSGEPTRRDCSGTLCGFHICVKYLATRREYQEVVSLVSDSS